MQQSKTLELLVGLFVASGIVALFFLAMHVSNLNPLAAEAGYSIIARFENTGGLKVKSPVNISGVRIGRVSDIYFDLESYESVVEMHIEEQYKTLPDDTSASILTAGLLGEQYVGLTAGGSEEFLEDGGTIDFTQSALVLENLIGQFLYQNKSESKQE
jgi:phospholipid/cholesterol/gamma-HCH transport system substrate-binding protein